MSNRAVMIVTFTPFTRTSVSATVHKICCSHRALLVLLIAEHDEVLDMVKRPVWLVLVFILAGCLWLAELLAAQGVTAVSAPENFASGISTCTPPLQPVTLVNRSEGPLC